MARPTGNSEYHLLLGHDPFILIKGFISIHKLNTLKTILSIFV